MGLRADASLLAVSDRFGVLFAGTAGGFKWAWLADLRTACSATSTQEHAADTFHDVPVAGASPFALAVNADETRLAVAQADGRVALRPIPPLLVARAGRRVRRPGC